MAINRGVVLIRQAGAVLALRVAGALLIFLANVFVANLIGVEQYGIASFLISAAMVAALFSVFGSNRILTKHVARSSPDKPLRTSRYYYQSLAQTLTAFVPAVSIVAIVLYFSGREPASIAVFAVIALMVSVKQLNEGYLLGRSRAVIVAIHESLTRPVGIVLILYVVSQTTAPDALSYLWAMGLTLGLIAGWHAVIIRPQFSRQAFTPVMRTGEWWTESYPFFVLTVAVTVQNQAGVFVLGLLDTDTETGLYAVAARISAVVLFASAATNMAYTASYSSAYDAGDRQKLHRDVRTVSLFTAAFVLLAFSILVNTTSFWLRLFGEEFVAAGTMLEIQAVALLLSTLCGPAAILLSMTEFAKESSKVMLAAAVLNICLTVVLVLLWRGIGAAIANLITVTWSNMALTYLAWKKIHVRSGIVGMLLFRTHE